MRLLDLNSRTSADLGSVPHGDSTGRQSRMVGVVTKVANRFIYPVEHPFQTLLLYYTLLVVVAWAIIYFFPDARAMISGERLAQLVGTGIFDRKSDVPAPSTVSWMTTLDMGLAMIGAFLLMLPTSWVYMTERRRKGFDQAIVQTMIVLSVAIAGVVVIVRNSAALAFSLTGIVAAVRYRNTLSDTRDTLYIFTCIGVGLAAGVQALAAALVLSAIFNFIILAFHRGDYGMCELGSSPGHLLVGAACSTAANDGKNDKKRKKDFNTVVVIRAANADRARGTVEMLLTEELGRFKLAEIETNDKGQGILKYLVRLGKKANPRNLEDALLAQGAPEVIGVRIH